MTPDEKWLPAVGYEGSYEVSDQGRVKSLARMVLRKGWTPTPERILKASPGLGGYPQVSMNRKTVRVHVLVAAAFLGPRPDGYEVCHNNGNRADCRLANLRYGTKSENRLDQVGHGNDWRANKTHCKHGHEFTPENTVREGDGTRRCRECRRINWRARNASKRAAAQDSHH